MERWTAVRFAAFSRALSLALQAAFNAVVPDHAADAFSPPRTEQPLLLDPLVEMLFGGLSHWDAEHFLFIAEHGYLYEHNFAFFPLFPLCLRAVSVSLLWPLCGWLSRHGQLLVSAVLVNSVLSVLAAVALYSLSCHVLQERRLALLSSLLFCLTPANVFLAAGYSESLFAALVFGGLWMLEESHLPGASVVLGLATAARANGLVNAGFLLYLPLQRTLAQALVVSSGARGAAWGRRYFSCFLTASFGVICVVFPFAAFQYYGYRTFCTPSMQLEQVSPTLLDLAQTKGYRVPDARGPLPMWCSSHLPLLYSYIQDVYWDVGFLRYFQLKQVPNFLLALPVAVLGAAATWSYASANWSLCLRLGLWGGELKRQADTPTPGFHNPKVFVYLVHFTFLLGFGVFCMHVQVVTRFLASSSPVLYWFCAHLLLRYEPLLQDDRLFAANEGQLEQKYQWPSVSSMALRAVPCNPLTTLLLHRQAWCPLTRWLLGYFISYWLLGLLLHCNSLPWT
ncbi:GPI mannosyltransferase 2-like [Scleropages formosus]|uniref:GPI mannosyltransferase 2 n=1 Tax=Scleropages formosus TaxID=113540 RepID=A0A0P7UTK9_SCLFO|nr:GPI mannosyltransferase 2-like [Scleropages formosus]